MSSRVGLNPDTEPKQALRISRYLAGAGSSLLIVLLLAFTYTQGMLELRVLIEATVAIGTVLALFYAVFRAGLNLRFPDPSLTLEQIIVATMALLYVMYQSESVRGILLIVYLMPLLFAQFRLDRARLLLLVLLLLLAYAGMVLLAAYAKPRSVDAASEVAQFVVLCAVLPWFAAMGGYLHSLRERLKQGRTELQQALETLQQTNQALQHSHAELDRLAGTDGLTGAWNRRRMDEAVRSEMDRLRRYDHALCLLVLDIDFFKKVNDRFGHAVGDQLLVELAAQIRSVLRSADSLTRWGGEEFVVLCPSTTLAEAGVLARRLREQVAATVFPVVNEITLSVGVAECLPGETWEQWFQRADAALFRAKSLGRNQVQMAPETPAHTGAADAVPAHFVQLVWHSVYECGHETVDREHKALFRDTNDVLSAVLSGRPAAEVNRLVDTLVRDIAQHFQHEESILAAAAYPDAAAHAALHRELAQRTGAMVERFRAGRADVGELFRLLAEDVVARHMLVADRAFLPYLKQQAEAAQRSSEAGVDAAG